MRTAGVLPARSRLQEAALGSGSALTEERARVKSRPWARARGGGRALTTYISRCSSPMPEMMHCPDSSSLCIL